MTWNPYDTFVLPGIEGPSWISTLVANGSSGEPPCASSTCQISALTVRQAITTGSSERVESQEDLSRRQVPNSGEQAVVLNQINRVAASMSLPVPRTPLRFVVTDRVARAQLLNLLKRYYVNTILRLDSETRIEATALIHRHQEASAFGFAVDVGTGLPPDVESQFALLESEGLAWLTKLLQCKTDTLKEIMVRLRGTELNENYLITRHLTRKGPSLVVCRLKTLSAL